MIGDWPSGGVNMFALLRFGVGLARAVVGLQLDLVAALEAREARSAGCARWSWKRLAR